MAFKQKISVMNKCNWPLIVDFGSVQIVRYPLHSLILAVLSWINFVTWRQTFKIKCKQCQNWNYILVYSKKKIYRTNFKKEEGSFGYVNITTDFWYHFLCVLHKRQFFPWNCTILRNGGEPGPFFQDQEFWKNCDFSV